MAKPSLQTLRTLFAAATADWGERDGYTAFDAVDEIFQYTGKTMTIDDAVEAMESLGGLAKRGKCYWPARQPKPAYGSTLTFRIARTYRTSRAAADETALGILVRLQESHGSAWLDDVASVVQRGPVVFFNFAPTRAGDLAANYIYERREFKFSIKHHGLPVAVEVHT